MTDAYVLPPSDADRELALIGLALSEGIEVVNAVGGMIQPDDFSSPARVAAWSAIVRTSEADGKPDVFAVGDSIAAESDMSQKDARAMLMDSHSLPFITPNAEALAGHIANLAARRRTMEKAQALFQRAYSEDGLTGAQITEQVHREFDNEDRRAAATEDTSFERCFDAALQPRANGWSTGVAKLTEWTGGIVPGRYYVVSGSSGFGKTWLMIRMAIAAVTAGARVIYVSREMDKKDMFVRVAAAINGSDSFRMNKAPDKWSDEDHERALFAARHISELEGQLDVSTDKKSPAEIGPAIRAGEFDVAFIDYAQILEIPGSDYDQMKEVESFLINLCKTGVAIVIGSQLSNRHVFGDQEDDTSGHLGGSRLNNGASADIRLRRDKSKKGTEDPDRVIIELRKHRHGPDSKGGATDVFRFDRTTGKIVLADDPLKPQPEAPSW